MLPRSDTLADATMEACALMPLVDGTIETLGSWSLLDAATGTVDLRIRSEDGLSGSITDAHAFSIILGSSPTY